MGSHREQNQDTFAIVNLASGQTSRPCVRTNVSVSQPGMLLLVCDGMGGAPAGDVAARVAASVIQGELKAAGKKVVADPGAALERAVEGAHRAIRDEATAHPEERGMGTTCTAAVFSPDGISVAQVGDSRAYLFRAGQLIPLTRDQTMATQLLEAGVLRPSQVPHYPYRHVLSQALGSGKRVQPVITDHELQENDRVMICSDGLYGPVDESTIATILGVHADATNATQALIDAALAAGGPDNVTVVVADCGPKIER
ncbi:MAG TPA: protein phosphatase 2C domain-containing protein [Polyangia bacterium]|nr:protein phosphatase 2C domain-containing protein [Polyangia bacterium]